MGPAFLPLYAPTFLHLEFLDGRSPAKMLWLSYYCWRRTLVSYGWGSTFKKLSPIFSILVGPWHCTITVSMIVPLMPLGGVGPSPFSSTSRANSFNSLIYNGLYEGRYVVLLHRPILFLLLSKFLASYWPLPCSFPFPCSVPFIFYSFFIISIWVTSRTSLRGLTWVFGPLNCLFYTTPCIYSSL